MYTPVFIKFYEIINKNMSLSVAGCLEFLKKEQMGIFSQPFQSTFEIKRLNKEML